MTKNELLDQVKLFANQRLVSSDELIAAYREGIGEQSPRPSVQNNTLTKHLAISELLYYIGGVIVFIGIAVLIGGGWDNLSSVARIFATLGSGLAAYISAALFSRYEKFEGVSQAFFLVAALVLPVGLHVIFYENKLDITSPINQTLISATLFAVYLVSYFAFRKAVFVIFSVFYGTWLFFAATNLLTVGNPTFTENYYLYRVLMAGLSYTLLGYYFSRIPIHSQHTGWLYNFGILGVLGSALTLGGWSPRQNIFWELVFPGLVFGVLFLSVYLKSKGFLVWGSIFLMAYILKITGEYFQQGLGWPLALVIAGLALIVVGYLSFYLNNKYLKQKTI